MILFNMFLLVVCIVMLGWNSRTLYEKRQVWREVLELLKLVQEYFQQGRMAHSAALREITPAAKAAAENTKETKDAVLGIKPVAEEVKDAVLKEIGPTLKDLSHYVHNARHDQRDNWYVLGLKMEVIARALNITLPRNDEIERVLREIEKNQTSPEKG